MRATQGEVHCIVLIVLGRRPPAHDHALLFSAARCVPSVTVVCVNWQTVRSTPCWERLHDAAINIDRDRARSIAIANPQNNPEPGSHTE